MSEHTIILSSSGLKNIVQNSESNAGTYFKFVFGKQEVKLKTIFAEFISPLVSQIHQSDPTVECIEFSNKTMQNYSGYLEEMNSEIFSLFERVSQGESICVNKEQSEQLQIISILVKNEELFKMLNELCNENIKDEDEDEEEKENIDKHIKFVSLFGENFEMNGMIEHAASIEYIASHMYSIDKNKINLLPKNIFYSIIKNENLKIENEDSLLDDINEFIKKKEENDQNGAETELNIDYFYEEINLEYLSEDKFKEFIEDLEVNDLTTNLWRKLKKCFYVNKNMPKVNIGKRYHHIGRNIEYDEKSDNAFKGIIYQLTQESGGNVDDKGIVKVTSSSVNSVYIAKYAVELDNCTCYFQSKSIQNSWLQYDFQNRKVHPTHYSIRTRHDCGKGGWHPKNWVIEGSNDEKKWYELDSRQNIACLDDRNAVHTFDIQTSQANKEFYQFLRIRLSGPETAGSYFLTLSALEYFGTITQK